MLGNDRALLSREISLNTKRARSCKCSFIAEVCPVLIHRDNLHPFPRKRTSTGASLVELSMSDVPTSFRKMRSGSFKEIPILTKSLRFGSGKITDAGEVVGIFIDRLGRSDYHYFFHGM